ncbi:hypothetical protein [Guptibacillus hwajinpoensis]|uniref:Uncharacterized protein n=1 Tax=Guptibacillus hwajinpoensis TaxID=208199 RepID=A0A0J6CRQ0_9BACL|nr:hypothetical protein [Alkalihalobacillus macyae]KMM35795.1 hypothetical protein AB986_20280 [Alkalihalobacillus macyae]
MEIKNNTAKQLKELKRDIDRLAALDIDDDKVSKQVIHRLVKSIEEEIKIHYNLSPSRILINTFA